MVNIKKETMQDWIDRIQTIADIAFHYDEFDNTLDSVIAEMKEKIA